MLIQYEEVYKDLTKNQTQLLITDFITKSRRSEIVPNSSTIEPESHQILSSNESDIIPIRKKTLIYESDDSTKLNFWSYTFIYLSLYEWTVIFMFFNIYYFYCALK